MKYHFNQAVGQMDEAVVSTTERQVDAMLMMHAIELVQGFLSTL
jgi:hypothetical protein